MIIMMLGVLHMFLHELGHLAAAFSVGSKVRKVGISWRGPYIVRSPACTPWRNAAVALAGPGANLLTWAILAAFSVPNAWVALFMACFNLLPMRHSDLTKCIAYLKTDKASLPPAPVSNAAPAINAGMTTGLTAG